MLRGGGRRKGGREGGRKRRREEVREGRKRKERVKGVSNNSTLNGSLKYLVKYYGKTAEEIW